MMMVYKVLQESALEYKHNKHVGIIFYKNTKYMINLRFEIDRRIPMIMH